MFGPQISLKMESRPTATSRLEFMTGFVGEKHCYPAIDVDSETALRLMVRNELPHGNPDSYLYGC